MDPDETLRRLQDKAEWEIQDSWHVPVSERLRNAEEMAELFQALDEWLSKGGFPPTDWSRS